MSSSSPIPANFADSFVEQFIVQLVNFVTAAFAFVVALLLNESINATIDISVKSTDIKKNAGVKWATFFIILIISVLLIAVASTGLKQLNL